MTGPGRYLRLKSAIVSTLAEVGDAGSAAPALGQAYERFRGEALLIAGETRTNEEFERLFPAASGLERPTGRAGFDPFAAASAANEARALLGSLAGWLDGFVLEEKFQDR